MKLFRYFIIIIGSVLFIPVSCTVGTVAGTPLIAWLDSRNVEKGDTVHSPFSVVAELKNDHKKVVVLNLDEMQCQLEKLHAPVSFIISKQSGSISDGASRYEYRVLENKTGQQDIEVVNHYKDGDNTIWSRYRVTDNNVFPLTSRMFYFGYMFKALLVAFIFSIVVFVLGRFLKRYYAKE